MTISSIIESGYTINDIDSESSLKELTKTLRSWKESVHERFGQTRSSKIAEDILSDRETLNNYVEVLNLIQTPKSTLEKQIKQKHERSISIFTLSDSRGEVQGVVSTRATEKTIYLSCLLSAPWNIVMKGKISERDCCELESFLRIL